MRTSGSGRTLTRMKRFEVWLARLDPAEGSEMRKTRPVVIVSPEELNSPRRFGCPAILQESKDRSPSTICAGCRKAGAHGGSGLSRWRLVR